MKNFIRVEDDNGEYAVNLINVVVFYKLDHDDDDDATPYIITIEALEQNLLLEYSVKKTRDDIYDAIISRQGIRRITDDPSE